MRSQVNQRGLRRVLRGLLICTLCLSCDTLQKDKPGTNTLPPTALAPLKVKEEPKQGTGDGITEQASAVHRNTLSFPPGLPRLVLLTAPWCQWCHIFEETVLSRKDVKAALAGRFEVVHINVDKEPTWMDLPGVKGLPTLAFFNKNGHFVSVRSGFQSAKKLLDLLESFASLDETGEVQSSVLTFTYPRLLHTPITASQAQAALESYEKQIFFKINSNDGGFQSPARHPYPDLLRELAQWEALGTAPARVTSWLDKTSASALRGDSPRLSGEPLPDMRYDAAKLREASRIGPKGGDSWREGIERLPQMDPYRGLQDQVDGGLFRYAAGPGWYNPHFERRAADNLSWALFLRIRGQLKESARIARFVSSTFSDGNLLNSAQRAEAHYYRLRGSERAAVPAPPVQRLWKADINARAARLWKKRCSVLLRIEGNHWPRSLWTREGQDEASPPAPVDAVGEILLGLSLCDSEEARKRGSALAETVISAWDKGRLPLGASTRLHRLAAGLCAALPVKCGEILASIQEMPLSLYYAPPLTHYARMGAKLLPVSPD